MIKRLLFLILSLCLVTPGFAADGDRVIEGIVADKIDAVALDVTGVTDGNIPYMQAAGAGFGDSPLSRVTAGQVALTKTAIGVTPLDTNGLMITNTTAAAAGAQQYSPPLVMQGQGWKTDATAASQKVEFMQDVRPVEGTAAPTGYWGIYPSIADAAYSATPAMTVNSTGNVGIGTTVPNGKLAIGTSANLSLLTYSPGAGATANQNILNGYYLSNSTFTRVFDIASVGFANGPSGDSIIRFLTNPITPYNTDAIERMRIDGNGNVGIGTTAPQSLLDVQGATGTGTATAGKLTLATKELTVVAGDELGRINFNAPLESDGTDAILPGASIWAVAEGDFGAASNATSLVFATGASEAATEKMRLSSTGELTLVRAITPGIVLRSSVCDDPDDNADIYANATATGTGAEVVDVYWRSQGAQGTAGTMQTIMQYDASAQSLLMGGAIVDRTTTVTAAGPTDNLSVAGINTVFVNTNSNHVTIGGFVGGVSGQTIKVVVVEASNNAVLEYAEGTGNQDIYLSAKADETITATYGGWTLVCNGTHWYEVAN